MTLPRETMLARMLASDRASDGRFVTGVTSTGIYCLPSCPARKPRPENVVFHGSPEEARAAGLRPCKRCRPDDFYLGEHGGETLVEDLAARVALDPGAHRNVGALAGAAGVSAGRLHDLFRAHYHTTPAEFLTRTRVRAARRALIAGERPVTDIAFEVGFESLSAFNHNFRRYSALSPQAFRRWGTQMAFELALPESYPREAVLRFLARDRVSLTERVEGDEFLTVMRLPEADVVVQISLAGQTARCTLVSPNPLGAEGRLQVHERLLGLLGLHVDPSRFEAQVSLDPGLAALVEGQRGLRPLLLADPFDALVWAVLGQHISFAFACILRRRLTERWGVPVAAGLFALPTPETVAGLEVADLRPLGFTRSKAEFLIGTAQAVVDGRLPLDALGGQSASRIERTLLGVRGLGPWSAQYLLMRAFGFLDCVPLGDSGLTESLKRFFDLEARPSPADTARLMSRFAPYRSLATFHLWRRLERAGVHLPPTEESP